MKSIDVKYKKGWLLAAMLFVFILLLPYAATGQIVFEDSLQDGENFEKIALRLYLDKDIETFKGIVVLVPGSNYDGRSMVNDSEWQDFARQHHFAVLACYFKDKQHPNMAIEEYVNVGQGSGQAFLDLITALAGKSGHPELDAAPLVLWGLSAGGEFNYEFVCWNPERVLAFVVNKGGVYYSALASAASREVPGLFFTGSEDSPYRNGIVEGIFIINRRFGAKWVFIEEEGLAHEVGVSKEFALYYFNAVIPLRLQEGQDKPASGLMNLPSQGYIGIAATKQIGMEKDLKTRDISSWFPTQQIAEKWLEIIEF